MKQPSRKREQVAAVFKVLAVIWVIVSVPITWAIFGSVPFSYGRRARPELAVAIAGLVVRAVVYTAIVVFFIDEYPH